MTTSPNRPDSAPDHDARYRAEFEDIKRDRAMAARFDPTTTIVWLAELAEEERAVRRAFAQLPRSA